MSANDGLCDKCKGKGTVELPLFFSMAQETCSLCQGSGKYIHMCNVCSKVPAYISIDLCGYKHINPCLSCQNNARLQKITEEQNTKQTIPNYFNFSFNIPLSGATNP